MKRKARLLSAANVKITKEDREFLYRYQLSVLLALKQAGALTQMQYRTAEEKLSIQMDRQGRRPG